MESQSSLESPTSAERGESVSSTDDVLATRSKRGGKGKAKANRERGGRGRGGRSRGGRSRGGRGRGGRGRGGRGRSIQGPRLRAEDINRVKALQQKRTDTIKNNISQMTNEDVRGLLHSVVERQPGLIFDVLEKTPEGVPQSSFEQSADKPGWCVCNHCMEMPTDIERLCCGMRPENCISQRPEMDLLVLDAQVINLGNLYRAEIFAAHNNQDNASMRHGAYRQFILWRHGKLGAGVRRIIPSCCIKIIRERYPSPNGLYKGFVPNRLI